MITKTKNTAKRIISFLLSFLVLFTTISITEDVGALSSSSNSTLSFLSSDVSWTNRTQFIGVDGYTSYVYDKGEVLYPIQLTQNGTSEIAYCLEPGKGCNVGDTYSTTSPNVYGTLTYEQKTAIGLILTYGYPHNGGLIGGADDKYVATQLLIWEIVKGYRSCNVNYNGKSYTRTDSKFYDGMSGNSNVVANYNAIQNDLQYHWALPSFATSLSSTASTYNMNYNESMGKYSVTLTDTNSVLSQYNFSSTSTVTVSQSGSKITLTSDKELGGKTTFSSQKTVLDKVTNSKIVTSINVWGNNSYSNNKGQSVVSIGAVGDPPKAYFNVQTINSSALQLRKTSDDGNVSDIYFLVSGNGVAGGTKLYCTDANGYINATDLPTNTELTIKELGYKNADGTYSLPSYYDTPVTQKVVLEPNTTATVTFHNSRNDKKLNIKKTAEDGNVANIAFEITDLTENQVLGIFTTDNSGNISIANDKLNYHTYSIKELGTLKSGATVGSQNADDYELSLAYAELPTKTVTIKPTGEEFTVSFYNTLVKGKIRVLKSTETFDAASSSNDLSGFQFKVIGIALNGQKYDQTFTTDANGYIEISELLVGKYTVTELENEKTVGYILPNSQTVDLSKGDAEITFENKLQRGDLTIIKTFEGKTTPLKNVPFHITGVLTATGETYDLGTLYTDKNGQIVLEGLPIGKYTVEELESELTEDFVLSEAQTVDVAYNQLKELEIQNDLKTGNVKIIKTSEDGIIKGIEFDVYVNGELKGTYKTNSKGEITIKNLKYNDSVRVHEIPSEKYQATKDVVKTIKSKTTTFEFENKLKSRKVEIIKTSEDGIIKGVEFLVSVNDGEATSYFTDSDGKIKIENLKYGDTVKVEEVAKDKYNKLDSITKVLTEEVTTFEFYNTLKERYVHIIKTSEDSKVDNIEFLVSVNDGKETSYFTDKDGKIELTFKYGDKVTVTEKVPNEYVAQNSQTKVLKDKITEFSFNNTLKRGSVVTTKIDSQFQDNKLTGAEFTIYNDVNGNGTYEEDIDTSLGIMTEITEGQYQLDNLTYGNYLLKETVAPEHYVLDKNYYSFSITENEQVVVIENNAGVGFVNDLQDATLTIKKKVETINAEVSLAGFSFKVTGTSVNGIKYSKTFTTDETGTITIKNLLVGTYKVTEIENDRTVGYIIPSSKLVDLTQGDKTVTFTNKLQRGDLTVVKTFEGKKLPIENVPFHIVGTLTATGETYELGTLYTNENGKIELTNLPIGTYTIVELESELTSDYILSEAETAIVAKDQLTELTILNNRQPRTVVIKKSAEDGNIQGIEFDVTVNDVFLGTYTTDENGEITINDLHYNDVVSVTEKTYEQYNEQQTQTQTLTKQSTTFRFKNTLKPCAIRIVKTSEDNNIQGIEFLVNVNDVLLGTFTTDENGIIAIENLKYNDVVTVKEVTPNAYNNTSEITAILTNEVTEFKFANVLKRGTVTTTKVDRQFPNNKLSGAEFTIYKDINGNGTYEEDIDTAIGTMSETETGIYVLDNLLYGDYLLKETVAPQYYQIDTNYYAFSITDDGQVVVIENVAGVGFVNDLMTAQLIINKKIESINNVVTLDGFEFKVSGISLNGTEIAQTYTTDENGIIEIQNLLVGNYTISEVENSKTVGYILPEDQEVVFLENTDLTFVNVEEPEETDTNPNPEDIDTGDNTDYSTLALITLLSLLSCVVLLKKKSNSEN